ncbi:lytic transglycosylase domain-containing protein [Pseudomonas oryzihabitans]|jgi:hypothetical protein|uniref:lytic transglycosylase domain-containing protein n=1 Tax=Pseudomonas oryzihabitans TaxID=47885 RepID=UPI001F3F5D95|nr:lytic transglycosylase domain-containing protein [Pseudomonas oryzihabitans]
MDAIPAQAPPVPVCMVEAARDYSIPLRGLISVWLTEGGKLGTLSPNKNGTIDHGPFQINTVWTDYLAKNFGVTKEVLTNDFCWSARAAAYILRYEINLAGGDFWEGVGHYHSRTPKFKYPYIAKVYNYSLRF